MKKKKERIEGRKEGEERKKKERTKEERRKEEERQGAITTKKRNIKCRIRHNTLVRQLADAPRTLGAARAPRAPPGGTRALTAASKSMTRRPPAPPARPCTPSSPRTLPKSQEQMMKKKKTRTRQGTPGQRHGGQAGCRQNVRVRAASHGLGRRPRRAATALTTISGPSKVGHCPRNKPCIVQYRACISDKKESECEMKK